MKCGKIKIARMRNAVNAAATPGEGKRVQELVAQIVEVGLAGGYLTDPRLSAVHWQPGDRPMPEPAEFVAGESVRFVDPSEIPGHGDIDALAAALVSLSRTPWWFELMPYVSGYSGLRIGELLALEAEKIDSDARTILVDREVIEVGGKLYVEPPKFRVRRTTIFPMYTPTGYPVTERMARRVAEVRAEQTAGRNPLGLMFPAARGGYCRYGDFASIRTVPAYLLAGWCDAGREWTWHSLRHGFCTTALNDWGLDIGDVSRLAGHSSPRITMGTCVGAGVGTLDRAFQKTCGPQ